MRIIWSPLAVKRAEKAVGYIARDKPGAARRWARGLLKQVEQLEAFASSGRVVPELSRPDTRELICESHRIVYRTTGDAVIVLTVRHTAESLDAVDVDE